VIPASFDYVRAVSLRDALNALAAGDGSKILAGGHSLLPMMRFRLAQPARLVDVSDVAELRGIAEHRKGARIGATTTYRDVLDSAVLRERFPLLVECTENIGDLARSWSASCSSSRPSSSTGSSARPIFLCRPTSSSGPGSTRKPGAGSRGSATSRRTT
jgi:carbon-monoxide dehydrogenase medium subunit